jgi:hypothetical protein
VVFQLSIRVTAHQKWDHTSSPASAGDCERTVRSEGIRDVRFRTGRPVVVRFDRGRILKTSVRGLTGIVKLAGANTITEVCGTQRSTSIQDCVETKRSFKGGSVGALGPRAGTITLQPVRNVRLRSISCPREPADILKTPLGLAPPTLHVSLATLESGRIRRFTVTASASRRKTYGSPEAGTLSQRAVWTLTFTRGQP